jgi:hypothetical protein
MVYFSRIASGTGNRVKIGLEYYKHEGEGQSSQRPGMGEMEAISTAWICVLHENGKE